MLAPFALVVGVVASIVLCIQNAGSLLGFGWALIHGAGPAAVIAFAPLGLGLGILWGGFRYLHRSNHRHSINDVHCTRPFDGASLRGAAAYAAEVVG
jgi:hypothetical protein